VNIDTHIIKIIKNVVLKDIMPYMENPINGKTIMNKTKYDNEYTTTPRNTLKARIDLPYAVDIVSSDVIFIMIIFLKSKNSLQSSCRYFQMSFAQFIAVCSS
jgi:hypothetical protein